MANVFHDKAKKNLASGTTQLLGGNLWCALVGAGYTPATTTDEFWSDAVAGEVSGTGYTANGVALSSVTVTADTTNHRGVMKSANTVFSTVTLSATGCVVYQKNGGANTTWPIVGYYDFGGTKTATAGNFTIQWDATNGNLYI